MLCVPDNNIAIFGAGGKHFTVVSEAHMQHLVRMAVIVLAAWLQALRLHEGNLRAQSLVFRAPASSARLKRYAGRGSKVLLKLLTPQQIIVGNGIPTSAAQTCLK